MDWSFIEPLKRLWPHKYSEMVHKIDWRELLLNPYFIGLVVFILAFAVYKRMYKFLALVFCSSAFYAIWRQVGIAGGAAVTPKNLLTFVGLFLVIIVVGIYFFFIRSD